MDLGTVETDPGELARGAWAVTDLPTGAAERLPVIVADGVDEGPTLWVTAAIHGDEVTGLAAAHDAMARIDPDALRGTVACLPCLNPAGLRRTERTSYYHDEDPNRYFPSPDPEHESARPPRVQERIDRRVYDAITGSADAAIALHTAGVHSVPFTIRARVRYGEGRTEAAAEALADELDALVEAFGLPVVNQYPPDVQSAYGLERSLASSLLLEAGIPAFTPELGSHSVVEEARREAAVVGVLNTARAMDMLPAAPAANEAAPDAPVDYPVRRSVGPTVESPGVVRHRVAAGDVIAADDPVATVVGPAGERRETVTADADGYVLGRREGVAVYENDPVIRPAVRDEEPLVLPWNADADEGDDA